jgi:hypothetical protein
VSDVKRLRELKAENARLKRMYANLALENAVIKDVMADFTQVRCQFVQLNFELLQQQSAEYSVTQSVK